MTNCSPVDVDDRDRELTCPAYYVGIIIVILPLCKKKGEEADNATVAEILPKLRGALHKIKGEAKDPAPVNAIGREYYIPISDTKKSPASSVTSTEGSNSYSEDVSPNTVSQEVQEPTLKKQKQKRNSATADVRLSMASNFSAAYNTVNISLALVIMQSIHPLEDPSSISTCSSALLGGMIIGQLGGGILGDWFGRHMAMAVVMTLQVVAALMSSMSGIIIMEDANIYAVLAGWRFLLGLGCGGVYPLAATLSSECSSPQSRAKTVALTFSMQGVGYFAVSLVAYLLMLALGDESDLTWRLLLGLGSLPGTILIATRLYHRTKTEEMTSSHNDIEAAQKDDTDELTSFGKYQRQSQIRLKPKTLFEQIRSEPNLLQKMVGTAGCWLLFDILFYGNTLFQPVVLSAAFGESETPIALVRDSMFISLMALPGYFVFVSVVMVGRQSPKNIQLQGFVFMSLLYTTIGMKFDSLNRFSLLGLYGLTFFFSNYGPNSTTFMLPSMTFSRPCRSSLNGVCAASGKVGALLGATIFLPLASWFGNADVMLLCASISIVSAILTFLFINDDVESSLEDNDMGARISSESHLLSLQAEIQEKELLKVVSMPTFLDLD